MKRERKCKDAEHEKKLQGSKALSSRLITARICDRLIGNSHPSHFGIPQILLAQKAQAVETHKGKFL